MATVAKQTRRAFIHRSLALGVATSSPTILPTRVLGRSGKVAPGNKITLGIIGIGPRCTYNLKAMLGLSDVQCVAIADVQASRRDAGKKLVDEHYGNTFWRTSRLGPTSQHVSSAIRWR